MTPAVTLPAAMRTEATASARVFALTAMSVAVAALLLAGWLPVGFSIVTVFLFAGPHNWIEFRYFLPRTPVRWGRLRTYFLLAFGGAIGLTVSFAALPFLVRLGGDSNGLWWTASAAWNSMVLGWIAVLVCLRGRQNPRRDWRWLTALTPGLIVGAWAAPQWCALVLTYLHPLLALWILDREIRRSRPAWRRAYHLCLACVPLLLGVLWWQLAGAPPLQGEDALTLRITRHAGSDVLRGISSHLLVSTHTFLEMLHYGVWIAVLPLVAGRTAPWRLDCIPLTRRSSTWRVLIGSLFAAATAVVLLLWIGFAINYPMTRDIYFTVALFHVLAEIPFLLRTL